MGLVTTKLATCSKLRRPIAFAAALLFACATFSCNIEDSEESQEQQLATEIAIAWNRLALEMERHTLGYRPPVGARMFAHIELAAYEASLPALPDYVSLETRLKGYEKPHCQLEKEGFYLPASLNAAYATILRDFFAQAPAGLQEQIAQLEQKFSCQSTEKVGRAVADASAAYGRKVAKAVWEWGKSDPLGHIGHLKNYENTYLPPQCEGCWKPTSGQQSQALLPYWGEVRPFLVNAKEIEIRPPVKYATSPGSEFYREAMEVYSVSQPLSKENIWIAEFWSDDLPGLTYSPAGRWISIATQALEKAKPPFPLVMETYLKTSIALCDAGIVTWIGKYRYNLERPETYIQKNINPAWKGLHESPTFPAYPSGHATFGAAAAEVLSAALGSDFQLSDRTHKDRPEFAGTPRTYQSFAEMAQENAASRVLLGVHFRMDCVEGLRLGKVVGKKAVELPLRRKSASLN
jgi:hypothetical protein